MVSTTARIDRRHEPKMQKANFELLWLSFEHETTKTKAKPKQFSPNPNFLQKMRIFPNHHSQLSKSNSSLLLYHSTSHCNTGAPTTLQTALSSSLLLTSLAPPHLRNPLSVSFLPECVLPFLANFSWASQAIFFFSRCTSFAPRLL